MDKGTQDPLIRSFERHLRAENRSERTIATYLIGRAASPSAVVEANAIACELPAAGGVPLGRGAWPSFARRSSLPSLADRVSVSTLWRWLKEDALKPWRHCS
jgi:hypothetical protein